MNFNRIAITIFYVYAVILSGSRQAFSSTLNCRDLFTSGANKADIRREMVIREKLESYKTLKSESERTTRAKAREIYKLLIEVLNNRGDDGRIVQTEDGPVLSIGPQKNGSQLGRAVDSLISHLEILDVVFDINLAIRAHGRFDPVDRRISVSFEEVISGQTGPTFNHEARHAFFFKMAKSGNSSVYHGEVSPGRVAQKDNPRIGYAYGFSLEELSTFALQTSTLAKRISSQRIESKRSKDIPALKESLVLGQFLSASVKSICEHFEKVGLWESRVNQDINVRLNSKRDTYERLAIGKGSDFMISAKYFRDGNGPDVPFSHLDVQFYQEDREISIRFFEPELIALWTEISPMIGDKSVTARMVYSNKAWQKIEALALQRLMQIFTISSRALDFYNLADNHMETNFEFALNTLSALARFSRDSASKSSSFMPD